MNRGEVRLVSLPFLTGREQTGQRPAVVIQEAANAQGSPLVLVVPLPSQLAAGRFPATVQTEPSAENGLALPSLALVFQTRALDRARFARRLGVLSAKDLDRVLLEFRRLTG